MKKPSSKILSILLVFLMLGSLIACGDSSQSQIAATASGTEKTSSQYAAKDLVSSAFIDPLTEWGKYDDLIAQIKRETNNEKRVELLHDAEDILMSTYCVNPVYYDCQPYLLKSYVEGVFADSLDNIFWFYAKQKSGADTLRVNYSAEPVTLDPGLISSDNSLVMNLFSGLYAHNENGGLSPACAESCSISDDGLTYTITLKKDLKWSDGKPLTAHDFEYSWKRAADPETAADYAYLFEGFKGYDEGEISVTAIDNTTLVFELVAPCAYMKELMAFSTFFPVQKEYVEAHSTKQAPGAWSDEPGFPTNGAYFVSDWTHDVSMTYEKNPNWYDADRVSINRIELMISDDEMTTYAAYLAGDIDFTCFIPTDEIGQHLNDPEFHDISLLATCYVAFNCKAALFEGKTPEQAACMRQAFSLLIDRDYICENITQIGQIAANSFVPLNMADGNGGVFKKSADEGYFDPYAINNDTEGTIKKAIELLEAAGYRFENGKLSEETPISFEYMTDYGLSYIAAAEAIKADFFELGIDLTIRELEWNVFSEERERGNYTMARAGWYADYNDPINMLEMWTTASGNNDCQFGR